ncbi:hypothetical protein J6590_037590 [Homalodisca vitripennis]|nr:hypothetical protein J6590_037590 [Homalodisca vitripennis]
MLNTAPRFLGHQQWINWELAVDPFQVTGAGRGLGRGLALGLAKEGCKVAVADVNKDNALDTAAEIVKSGGVAKAYFTNVAKVEEIRELREAVTTDLGPVDILLNNAGLVHGDPLEVDVEEAIKGVIAVNLLSHFWMVREFLPTMRECNPGHIAIMATLAVLFVHCQVRPCYDSDGAGVPAHDEGAQLGTHRNHGHFGRAFCTLSSKDVL